MIDWDRYDAMRNHWLNRTITVVVCGAGAIAGLVLLWQLATDPASVMRALQAIRLWMK